MSARMTYTPYPVQATDQQPAVDPTTISQPKQYPDPSDRRTGD